MLSYTSALSFVLLFELSCRIIFFATGTTMSEASIERESACIDYFSSSTVRVRMLDDMQVSCTSGFSDDSRIPLGRTNAPPSKHRMLIIRWCHSTTFLQAG